MFQRDISEENREHSQVRGAELNSAAQFGDTVS